MTAEDLERLTKLLALIQESVVEIGKFIQNAQSQSGKSTEEILTHAEQTTKQAQELINSL